MANVNAIWLLSVYYSCSAADINSIVIDFSMAETKKTLIIFKSALN